MEFKVGDEVIGIGFATPVTVRGEYIKKVQGVYVVRGTQEGDDTILDRGCSKIRKLTKLERALK